MGQSAPLICGLGPRRRSDKRTDEPEQGQEDPEEEHPTVAPFQRPDPERDQHHEIQKSSEPNPPPHGFLLCWRKVSEMLCPALQDAVVVNPQLAGGELRCSIVSTAMTRTP